MNRHNRIEVIDRNGWRREFSVEKTIIHIGSAPGNDIVLEPERGTGVAPLHAQLITSTSGRGYQLVNLGDADILIGPSGDHALSPRSVTHIANETAFKLGDFTLVFYSDGDGAGDSAGGFTGSSQNIGLRVSLSQTRLAPHRSLDGVVTVGNLGDLGGVQFNLELQGLEPDCYDIEPGPVLSSGVEKEILFHLHHRGNKPLAGDYYVTVRATAPRAYPGEEAIASQVIQVSPFYRHKLRLLPPEKSRPSPRVEEQPVPTSPTVELAKPKAEPSSKVEDWWAPTPLAAPTPAPQVEPATLPRLEVAERAIKAEIGPPPPVEEPVPEIEAEPPSPAAAEPMPPIEADLPAQVEEEKTPEAEIIPPVLMEDEWALEAQTGPQVEEWPAEPETDLPAWVEEEEALETEPFPPTSIEDERTEAEAEASLPAWVEEEKAQEAKAGPQAEEPLAEAEIGLPTWEEEVLEAEADAAEAEQMPEVEATPPAPKEDWWTSEAEAGLEERTEERRMLKLKASPPPETKVEGTQDKAGPLPTDEDWWTPEAEAGLEERTEERQVLKLKASPPSETEAEETQVGPPPPAEDWWTPEAQAEPEQQTEKRQVLELKASPPPEMQKEQGSEAETNPPPSAED